MLNEDKATRYHRLKRRASILGTMTRALCLLLLLISGASSTLRDTSLTAVGHAFIPAIVVYVVMLSLLLEVIHAPWAFYAGVTLERRYSLSTETAARWWVNHLKGTAIGLLFSIGAALIVLTLLRWSPERWWISAA